jgi:hypothetical protein
MLHSRKLNQWIIPLAVTVLFTACTPKEKEETKKTEPVINNVLLKGNWKM